MLTSLDNSSGRFPAKLFFATFRFVRDRAFPIPSRDFMPVSSSPRVWRFCAKPMPSTSRLISLPYILRWTRLGRVQISEGTDPFRPLDPSWMEATEPFSSQSTPYQVQKLASVFQAVEVFQSPSGPPVWSNIASKTPRSIDWAAAAEAADTGVSLSEPSLLEARAAAFGTPQVLCPRYSPSVVEVAFFASQARQASSVYIRRPPWLKVPAGHKMASHPKAPTSPDIHRGLLQSFSSISEIRLPSRYKSSRPNRS
mmetsp:Transcript_9481/g.20516  ORF Transcript_9481/g.20516 Transcript_9481/m.20516 type:complete len:254 (-) Transcript_9481:2384-3145(-)